jgi:hypothetical protein
MHPDFSELQEKHQICLLNVVDKILIIINIMNINIDSSDGIENILSKNVKWQNRLGLLSLYLLPPVRQI